MSHIFVSYSRKDFGFASKIVQALAENKLDTWIDWKSIPKGEDWEQEIYRGIEEADAFLFLISPDSVASQMCNKEISHAVKNGKRILPIVIRDTDPKVIHPEISKRNWIFCRDGQDVFKKAIAETRGIIHADYEWMKYHTKIQVKALDWEHRKDRSRLLRGKELRETEELFEINNRKDPLPTKIQREYLLASQRNEELQRRRTIRGLSVGFIVILGFAIFAVFQWQRAEQQSKIILSRQLASQAQLVFAQGSKGPFLSLLLSIAAMQIQPSLDADMSLRQALDLIPEPIARLHVGSPVRDVLFLQNGKWVVSSSEDGGVRVWDISTGVQVAERHHGEGYVALDVSPNGNLIASGGRDGIVKVWNAANGTELSHFDHLASNDYEQGVFGLDFSPDGNLIASSFNDGEIVIWEAATGRSIEIFHLGDIVFSPAVSFSPDGKLLAATGNGFAARVWEISSGKIIADIKCEDILFDLAFSPDSKKIITGSWSEQIWSLEEGKSISLRDIGLRVFDVGFSPNGQLAVSGGQDKTVHIWNVNTSETVQIYYHDESVLSTSFSADSELVVSGSSDNTARVWSIKTGQELSRFQHDGSVKSVLFSPDQKWVASGSEDGTVAVWYAKAGQELLGVQINGATTSLEYSPTGNQLAFITHDDVDDMNKLVVWDIQHNNLLNLVEDNGLPGMMVFSRNENLLAYNGYDNNALPVWDASTGAKVMNLQHPLDERIHQITFSPQNYLLLSSSDSGVFRLWDLRTGNVKYQTENHLSFVRVAFSPNGQLLTAADGIVLGAEYGHIQVFDVDAGKVLYNDWYHEGAINDIIFSPDGGLILSGGNDSKVRVWSISSGEEIARLEDQYPIQEIAISPDNNLIVTTSYAVDDFFVVGGFGNLQVWEMNTWNKTVQLLNDVPVHDIGFSQDGRWFLAKDRLSLRVWNTKTWLEVIQVSLPSQNTQTALSPSGNQIALGDAGYIRILSLDSDVLVRESCNRLYRNLTRAEWKQYIGDAMPYRAVCLNLPIEP